MQMLLQDNSVHQTGTAYETHSIPGPNHWCQSRQTAILCNTAIYSEQNNQWQRRLLPLDASLEWVNVLCPKSSLHEPTSPL